MSESELRSPDSFDKSKLAVADFDGTIAQTFEPSPANVDVDVAYEAAVEHVFGKDGVDKYIESGGLQNRAPGEVVSSLAPEGTAKDELAELTDQLVHIKLDILLGEIGTYFPEGGSWPRPMPGYIDFLKDVQNAQQSGQPVDHLVLSSGHVPFIKKTFDSWGASLPDHIIAEETLKALKMGDVYKPSSELMDVAEGMWRQNYGLNRRPPIGAHDRQRIRYIGDSLEKDGGLAANSGVSFRLIERNNSAEAWKAFAKDLDLGRIAINRTDYDTK